MNIEVSLEGETLRVFEQGLANFGLSIGDLSEGQIGEMLSYALGFVNYANVGIMEDCLVNAGVEFEDSENI